MVGIFVTFAGLLVTVVVCTVRQGWEDGDRHPWDIWLAIGLFMLGGMLTYVGL